MTDLVKIKGLKGKQNKKKWAKNIDVSELLQARARAHDEEIREKFRPQLEVQDDNLNLRPPLDPNRFKNKGQPLPKPKYNNRIAREPAFDTLQDPWAAPDTQKHKYRPTEIPAIIAPESGHSYNPRESDIQKLKDRVIDYEQVLPFVPKVKAPKELPVIEIRHRNKKKRAAQLEARARAQDKEFRQQLHHIKKIKKELQEQEEKIVQGIKTKQIKKEKQQAQTLTGRVRKGKKLGKRVYKFKEYIPEGHPEKVSKVQLNDELVRQRFDSIYRRGIFQARNVKVHRNKRKNIKVKERGFFTD